MAADISLIIDVQQKGVVKAVKDTKTLEGNVKLLSKAYKAGDLSQRQYYKGLKELGLITGRSKKELQDYANLLRRNEREQRRAADAARANAQAEREFARARRQAMEEERRRQSIIRANAQAEREAAQAARSRRDASRRLRMEFKEGYAAQVALRAAQMRLNQAHRQGIITAEEYQRQLQRLGQAAQQGGRHMSRSGVLVQQSGYQVGDFIVQLQGGTNAFVAFGQQATQIAGTLTMLGGKWILIGSVLGVTIPLVTALGAALMRANVEVDAIYNKFGFLEGSVRGVSSAFAGAGGVILNTVMTVVNNLDVFVTILGVSAVAAVVKFVAATSAMGTVITATQLLFSGMAGAQLVAASATTALTAAMSRLMVVISAHPIIAAMTAALAAAVFILYRARDASSGFQSNVEGLSEALKELRDSAKEAGIEAARIELGADTGAQAIAMQRILELNDQIAAQRETTENSAGRRGQLIAQRKLNDLIAEREEIEKLLEADRERVRIMESAAAQSSLDSIISSYDEQYAIQVQINDAQDKLNEAVSLGLIDQEAATGIMEEYKANLTDTVDKANEFADALREAASAMQSLAGFSEGLDKALAVSVAKVQALRTGADAAVAGTIAGMRADLESRISAASSAGVDRSIVEAMYGSDRDKISQLEESLKLEKGLQDTTNGGAGPQTDPLLGQLEQLETFLSTERELLLTEYETRQMTLEQSLESEYLTRQKYAAMVLELEGRKNKELSDIEVKAQQFKVSVVAGGIQDVLNAAAGGNDKFLKAARVTAAAAALINTYLAASQTLADPTVPFYLKFGAAASILAAGFNMVNAIKSGSSKASGAGGGSIGSAPSGSEASVPTQATATPQRVIIEGIDRNSLISGEQLSNIFEALYKENENRGFVFEVAR